MDFAHRLLLFIFSLLFLVPASSLAVQRCSPKDKNALLDFKNSFSNPNVLLSWTPETDCCNWYVVDCDEKTNVVTGLTITYGEVAGRIPDAVARLTHLQTLRLKKLPNLIGEIPPSIANLTNLVSLQLSWTNISGPVPAFLANLRNLEFLDLSFNKLSGSIPPTLANLPKILEIRLDRNRLTGSIPEAFGHFTGTVPDLKFSHNGLSGDIPASLGNMDFMRIDFSRNNLVGDASMLFNASKKTQQIDISRNMLEFDFSRSGFPPGTLNVLDISHNKIRGNIPSQITDAIYLQFLNVSYNRMCGEIPQGWKLKYRAEKFDYSSFFHNRCLCGPPLQACKTDGI
ncbi:polygalacturonase inhibitor 1-like [Magnolia sinica]|uniref:polygalacturonase inhibitor 1-like n=1 Tax=Magnolia sinica TaxID=86752 RepID=UPI00265A8B72|nr:polygalacturonase inhibitor 1-like [Magnolia sinica]